MLNRLKLQNMKINRKKQPFKHFKKIGRKTPPLEARKEQCFSQFRFYIFGGVVERNFLIYIKCLFSRPAIMCNLSYC